MKVVDWVREHPRKLLLVQSDDTLEKITELMLEGEGARELYVGNEDGKLLGYISYKKLSELLLVHHFPVHTRRQMMHRIAGGVAHELMDAHVVTCHTGEILDDVIFRQMEHDIEDMPVLDDQGQPAGVIHQRDVIRYLSR